MKCMSKMSKALICGAILLLFVFVLDSHAAFPGANGKIAFQSNRDGNVEIYVMNDDGTGQTNLSNNSAADGRPSWSADGTQIAFESNRDGNFEIYVMNADGSNQTQLTFTSLPTSNFEPSWSPDGTKIAFASDRDGNGETYVMNDDGTGQTNLSNNSAADVAPSWSPDGTQIAFVSNRDGNFEIYVMNDDGTSQTRLTTNPAGDVHPSWSPDGSKIAFTSDRDGNGEIYVMNDDGTGQTNLSNDSGGGGDPDWQPLPNVITCIGFESPMDKGPVTVKKNRVLPFKATLLDDGNNPITDADIISHPVIQVLFDSGIALAVNVTNQALSAGQGTDGNIFEFGTDKWQFNLKTKNYTATGTYTNSMVSGDDAEYVINPRCEGIFVIE